jgi:hypothetical protein
MKIDISDTQIWQMVRDLDECTRALQKIDMMDPQGKSGAVAREALASVKIKVDMIGRRMRRMP